MITTGKPHARFKTPDPLLVLYAGIAIIASVAEVAKGVKIFDGREYTHFNNYLIFKHSFFNLLAGKDLYQLYPEQFFDYFKYSPTFAILMAPLAILPNIPGYIAWNLLNALALFFAIKAFPLHNNERRTYILWFILLELLTNLQNAQSNGIMAALMIFAFNFFEKRRVFWAAMCIMLSFYIKLFGIATAILFLLYEDKPKFLGSMLLWGLLLGSLPLLSISPQDLWAQYQSWQTLLQSDLGRSYGLSVMGILQSWFGVQTGKTAVIVLGLLGLLLPFLRAPKYGDVQFRQFMLASLMIWVVLFNSKAESPTFIIAVTGMAIWYFTQPRQPLNLTLMVLAFVFTSLSPTDLFPRFLKKTVVTPYKLKALPGVLIWVRLQYQLWRTNHKTAT